MSNYSLNSLLKEYEQKKLNAELDLERRKETLYKLIPRLEQIDLELSSAAFNTAKNILNNVSGTNSVDNLKLKIENLKKNIITLQQIFTINCLKLEKLQFIYKMVV